MTAEAKQIVDDFRALPDAAKREVLAELVRISGGGDESLAEKSGESALPLWQAIIDLGATVPPEEWDRVPSDLAANLDHYPYGYSRTLATGSRC